MENSNLKISPDYILDAEKAYLEADFRQSIKICKTGIEEFPDYLMGFILLAESFEAAGDTDSANIIFNGAKEIFPGNKTLISISNHHADTGFLRYDKVKANTFLKENIFQKFERSIQDKGFVKPKPENLTEEPIDLTEHNPEAPVSENLAEILVRQKKFKPAIEMYLKLISSNPEKTDLFIQKIELLKKLAENESPDAH